MTRGDLNRGGRALAVLLGLAPAASRADGVALHRFTAVAISPDGAHVASIEADQMAGGGELSSPQLVIRDVASGTPARVVLPCGEAAGCGAFSPVWAPDGQHLAFGLRTPGTLARSLYRVDPAGGHLERVVDFTGTLVALRYAPDGRLAVLATDNATKEVGAARAGAVETGEVGGAAHDQRIAVIEDGALHWASPPGLFVHEYDWMPDGTGFVGTAAPGEGDANWWSARLYAFDTVQGPARLLYAPANPRVQIAQPKVSPDAKEVSFIGGLMSDFENPGGDAFVLPLQEAGTSPVNLTRTLAATVLTLRWGCATGQLLASVVRGAEMELATIDTASAASRVLWSARDVLNGADTAVSLDCRTSITATIRESYVSPPEIAVGPLGAWRALTAANAGREAPVSVRSLEWRSDGRDVQGWLVTPRTAPPGAKLPMITAVHGGPAAAYQPNYFGPGFNRALVEHGFALFLPNPRGSYGQGQDFTLANVRDLGHGDLRDILAGIDAAIREGGIDAARLGLTGSSYGGFMTLWANTQTHRFRAAVARAGISDWQSYYGQNGIGGWLLPYFGASVYDDPAVYSRSSPIVSVRTAITPTLLLVGERDIECPPPQSQEFWHALRELGTPTRLVVYPGEGHDYWSAGTLADAERRALAWFDTYLR